MPWLPDSVFRASAGPRAADPELDAEAAGLGTAGADVDGARLVAVAPAAADVLLLDALLQAAVTIAMAARARPRPAPRTEVLRSIKILPGERGPADDPHVMAHLLSIQRTFLQYGTGAGKA